MQLMQSITQMSSMKPPIASTERVLEGAKVTDSGIRAGRELFHSSLEWFKIPPISGMECVRALERTGLTVEHASEAVVTLGGQAQSVQVPLVDRLSPDILVAILIRAGVGPTRFMDLLNRLDSDH